RLPNENHTAMGIGPLRRSALSPAVRRPAPLGPECTGFLMAVGLHWLWESRHEARDWADTSWSRALAAIFPATLVAPASRYARSSGRPPPALRGSRGTCGRLLPEHRFGISCPRDCRTAWPVRPWLSSVMWSVVSEPIKSRLLGLCQSSGSYDFPSFVLKQGAFARLALPSVITTTPPSAIHVAGSIPHGITVAYPPKAGTAMDFPCCTIGLCSACCHHYPGGTIE